MPFALEPDLLTNRLSTVRSADKIVAIRDGEAVESGTHEELMKAKGLYHSLVLAQISQVRKRKPHRNKKP